MSQETASHRPVRASAAPADRNGPHDWVGRSRRLWEVYRALVVAQAHDSHELTAFGLLKWALEPLSFMVVYFLLIAAILQRSRPMYPLFLMTALLPFQYFSGVTTRSMSLVERFSNVLGDVALPKGILPVVVLSTEMTNLLVGIVLFAPFVVAYHVDVWPAILWLPALMLNLAWLAAGPAYFLTVIGLYFPDFRGIVVNGIRGLFFLSTALFPAQVVPGHTLHRVFALNPLSGIFNSFRAVVMNGRSPRAFSLGYPFLCGLVMLVVGVSVYRWRQRHFPKEV